MPGGYVWEAKRQSIFCTRRMVITRCSALAVAAVCVCVWGGRGLVSHRMFTCLDLCVWWYLSCCCHRGLYIWLATTQFHPLYCALSLQLFELLGPEGLEMISTLLQQRGAIVNSLLAIPSDRTGYPSGETASW